VTKLNTQNMVTGLIVWNRRNKPNVIQNQSTVHNMLANTLTGT